MQVICWVLGEYGTCAGASAQSVIDKLAAIIDTQVGHCSGHCKGASLCCTAILKCLGCLRSHRHHCFLPAWKWRMWIMHCFSTIFCLVWMLHCLPGCLLLPL